MHFVIEDMKINGHQKDSMSLKYFIWFDSKDAFIKCTIAMKDNSGKCRHFAYCPTSQF